MGPFEWLERAAAGRPEHPAFLWRGTRVSYGELSSRAAGRAADLARLGIGPGDRVVVLLGNTPAFAAMLCALLRRGAVVSPLNQAYHRAAMAEIIAAGGARHLVTTAEYAASLRDMLAGLPVRVLLVDEAGALLWPATAAGGAPAAGPELEPPPPGTAIFCPTSGSTGHPKLIMITREQLAGRVAHAVEGMRYTPDDVALGALPFLNGFGRDQILLAALMTGGTTLLQERFNPRQVLKAAAAGDLTVLVGVGFMYRALLDVAAKRATWPRVRLCMIGASFFPRMGDEFHDRFGHHLHNNYGSGEYSQAAINWDDDPESNWRYVGRPLPGCAVRILPAGFDIGGLGPGIGEIWVKSLRTSDGRLSAGYYRDPAATAEHYRGEWAHAADLGRFDAQGRLELIGRTRNMIKFAGVQVSGEKIEQAIMAHPAVAEAAVVWDRSPVWGEAVRAFVVSRGPLAAADVFEHCRTHLPGHMVPREVQFLADMPRTPTGKVDRLALAGGGGGGGHGGGGRDGDSSGG